MNNIESQESSEEALNYINQSVNRVLPIKDDKGIKDNPYKDEFTTLEQRARDRNITELLRLYVASYKNKIESNKWYKFVLFVICILILVTFSMVLIHVILTINDFSEETTVANVVQLISACVTFITLIVGILEIITKYVFPANDEDYITKIVELIQKNDLENKKENIKAKVPEKKDDSLNN